MIEVAEIGSMSPDFDNVSGSVLDWLDRAGSAIGNIEIQPNCSLQRIVFEEGEAIGVVFSTPDGPLAVHARHGVTVATGSPRVNTPSPHRFRSDGAADLRVCLVSRHASRFGRLELLTSDPIARPRSVHAADRAAVRCTPTYGRRAASHPHGVAHGETVIRRRGSSDSIAPRFDRARMTP